MVVDNFLLIELSIDPLTFVLHSIATLGMVIYNESLNAFLFVHLSAFANGIVPGNWYCPVFRPASEIDVHSLLRGCLLYTSDAADE